MSVYATIADNNEATKDRDGGDIATNFGWSDFVRWVGLLDGPDELNNLTQHGWSNDGQQLVADLESAIKDGKPTDDQKSIAEGILKLAKSMKDGDVLTISDGAGVDSLIESEASV